MKTTALTIAHENNADAAAARLAVKRHMRATVGHAPRADSTSEHAACVDALRAWLVSHPIEAARIIEKLVNASATAWTKGTDGRNAGRLAQLEIEHERKARQAEIIAGVFGVTMDWPGLSPCMQHPNGREYYAGELSTYVRALKGE